MGIASFSGSGKIDVNDSNKAADSILSNSESEFMSSQCSPLVITSELLENSSFHEEGNSRSLLAYYQVFGSQFCIGDCPIIIIGQVCCEIVVPGPEFQ
tara:strand:- start:12538 stop:12831 length:294 start_codon:yes stop_codon:yes gene_type:complete